MSTLNLKESVKESYKPRYSFEDFVQFFQKDFSLRTEDEHEELFVLLRKIPHFKNYLDSQSDKKEALLRLSKALHFESYQQYQALYHQGNLPQKVYIILKGDLRSYTRKTSLEEEKDLAESKKNNAKAKLNSTEEAFRTLELDSESEVFRNFNMDKRYFADNMLAFKHRKTYGSGDYLGELPMIVGGPYDNTLIPWTNVDLVYINKAEFLSIFEEIVEEAKKKISFFERIFPHADPDTLSSFAYNFDKKILQARMKVFQQGMSPDMLYIVEQGEVELLETHNIEGSKEDAEKVESKLEKNFKNNQKAVKLSVSLISRGQFFGEELLLGLNERLFTAVTKSAFTVVYAINKSAFVALAHRYPQFIQQLVLQAKISLESKVIRAEGLKMGAEKMAAEETQNSPKKMGNSDKAKHTTNHGDEEPYQKEIVDFYTSNAMLAKAKAQESKNSIRSKGYDEKLSLSPRAEKTYKKMADLKSSMVSDKVRVDPKLYPEARKEEEQKSEDLVLPKISGNFVDLTKKCYYPDSLFSHMKKFYEQKARRPKKEVLEKQYASQLIKDAEMEAGKEFLTRLEGYSFKKKSPDRVNENSRSSFKISKTMQTDHSEILTSTENSPRVADKSKNMSPGNSPRDYMTKFSPRLSRFSSISGIADIQKLRESDKIEYLHSQLHQFITPRLSKLEKSDSSQALSFNRASMEADKALSAKLAGNSQKALSKLLPKAPAKASESESFSPRNVFNSQKMSESPSHLTIRAHALNNNINTGIDKSSMLKTEESEREVFVTNPMEQDKKVKLPKITNKKIISSKHNLFRAKPSSEKFIKEHYHADKYNIMP